MAIKLERDRVGNVSKTTLLIDGKHFVALGIVSYGSLIALLIVILIKEFS